MKLPKTPKSITSIKRRIAELQTRLRKVEAKYNARVQKIKAKQAKIAKKASLRSELKRLSSKRAA